MKMVIAGYLLVDSIIAGSLVSALAQDARREAFIAILVVGAILNLMVAMKHIRRHFITLAIDGETLRYEEGMISKTTRSLNIHKVQDVRVDQTIGDRILSTGTLTLETAGETGRLTMANIDRPQAIAEQILALARRP